MKKFKEILFKNFKNSKKLTSLSIVIFAYLIIELLIKTGNISSLLKSLLVPVCCYIVVALALNLVVGFSGELSLGHAAFMCIGAYSGLFTSTLLESTISNGIIRLIIAIIVGMIFAGIFGFFIGIPVLKLEGDYLAIVTLAFCQIIKSLLNNVYLGLDKNGLHFSFIENKVVLESGKMIFQGPMGATAIRRVSNFTAGVAMIIISLIVIYSLMESKYGRAITASRDNRIAANASGINVTKTKMLAFVISSALAGGAGAIFGLNFSMLSPSTFDYNLSITILVYVVLGGLGNISGTIISTTILVILPNILTFLDKYRMLVYSIVLIAMMLIINNKNVSVKIETLKKRIKK